MNWYKTFQNTNESIPVEDIPLEEDDAIGVKDVDNQSQTANRFIDRPWHKKRLPWVLQGLAAEANKSSNFEEFEHDYIGQIKHGLYYHWTDNPNFTIDPNLGPRDMSSLSIGNSISKGKLMVTSDPAYWGANYKNRKYVAIIDMSNVPRNAYRQVQRGFGNEFFVNDPSLAKVIKVIDRRQASRINSEHHNAIPQSQEELKDFYRTVTRREE
jgi:hypothetical protein